MVAHYDYLTFTLECRQTIWRDFVSHIQDVATPAIIAANGELLGLFQGQLGFASNAAVMVLRWTSGVHNRLHELDDAPGVTIMHEQKLSPTVRPTDDGTLKSGGIYVHRWFTVDADRAADFVALSNQAWENFEGSYQTEIFGLFTAERTAQDLREGASRLLLLTYYASHGVWQGSREQTRDPNGLFVQRHALTRWTVGRSSHLISRG